MLSILMLTTWRDDGGDAQAERDEQNERRQRTNDESTRAHGGHYVLNCRFKR